MTYYRGSMNYCRRIYPFLSFQLASLAIAFSIYFCHGSDTRLIYQPETFPPNPERIQPQLHRKKKAATDMDTSHPAIHFSIGLVYATAMAQAQMGLLKSRACRYENTIELNGKSPFYKELKTSTE